MPQALQCTSIDIRNAIIDILKADTYIGGLVTDNGIKVIRTRPLNIQFINKYPAISVYNIEDITVDSNNGINKSYDTKTERFFIDIACRALYSNTNDSRYWENARDEVSLLRKSIEITLTPTIDLNLPPNTILDFRFTAFNPKTPVEHNNYWHFITVCVLEVDYEENLDNLF